MATPLIAVVGLGIGATGAGAVVLGVAVATLAIGPIGPSAPDPARATGAISLVSAVSPAALAAAQAAAATCPGLDWALLAGGALVDPSWSAGLAPAATALCASSDRAATLVGLMPGAVQGEVALVLAHALDADAWLSGAVATALTFAASNLGVPYRWGGTGPGGFDCSGLTLEAYQAAGVTLPRVAQDQFDAGPAVPVGAPLQPGDLVFFGRGPEGISHVGLYIGGGDMIDAPHTGTFVRVEATPTVPGAAFGSDLYVGATRPTGLGP